MIAVRDCNLEDFKQQAEEKKIFCFGAGKYFRKFISDNPEIFIFGVIDNYCQDKEIDFENKKYPLYSLKEFCEVYSQNSVLVVTIRAFEEIIDQLDKIRELDGISCFWSIALDNYKDIEDEKKYILKNQIAELSKRNHINSQKCGLSKKKDGCYQIWEYYERNNYGGSKARIDICNVLASCGYSIKKIHCSGKELNSLQKQLSQHDWEELFDSIENDAILFMQHPAPQITELPEKVFYRMKNEKHVRFIVMIHEVESLRKQYDSCYRQKEFNLMLSIGDVFIVHNDVMRQFFIDKGIEANCIISLEIFDYLGIQTNTNKIFERSVTIAANLDLYKSPFLLKLKKIEHLKVHLYGSNYVDEICENAVNIKYHGSFPTEIIPLKLDRGFGLIWDGNSIETCSGGTGEYLKYNNPHKLSLYLSSGLPVIIWSGAAQAQFVKKNKVGFCVDSLYEIYDILKEMNEEQYCFYVKNAERLSQNLKKGWYIKTALERAEDVLCQKYQ